MKYTCIAVECKLCSCNAIARWLKCQWHSNEPGTSLPVIGWKELQNRIVFNMAQIWTFPDCTAFYQIQIRTLLVSGLRMSWIESSWPNCLNFPSSTFLIAASFDWVFIDFCCFMLFPWDRNCLIFIESLADRYYSPFQLNILTEIAYLSNETRITSHAA